jgi:hypothetical protein
MKAKWKISPIPQSPNPNQRRNTRGREQSDSTPVLQELRADLIGSCTPSIKMATTVSKFDDFARARLGPGPLSMELASELRMSKVMQLCAAIAPRGFVLPKHLNLMSSDAGNRAPCAGLIFTDPDDAVTQRKPTSQCGIHDDAPRVDLLMKEDRRAVARERHGLFRCGTFRSGPCATPISPKYSGAVFRSCPPGPNTWTLNIQPLGQFRPHRGVLLARSTLPSRVARLLHTAR